MRRVALIVSPKCDARNEKTLPAGQGVQVRENSPRTFALPANLRGNNGPGDSNAQGEHGGGMIPPNGGGSTDGHFSTVILPFIRGWYLQAYLKVPAFLKVYSKV